MHSPLKFWNSPLLTAVLTDESGQDMAEYAVLIGLVAIVVVASVVLLGGKVSSVFNGIGSSMTLQ